MSTRALTSLAGLLFLMTGANASASAQACEQTRTTTVIFGNGMFNQQADAMTSVAALRNLMLTRAQAAGQSSVDEWGFEVAYNESEAPLQQLFQVAKQRLSADRAHFWRILSGIEPAPGWFRDMMLSIANDQVLAGFVGDQDLARHVARYRRLVQDGSKVVLVAHSQGNLYANAAYISLFDEGVPLDPAALGIVSVATPTDFVAGQGTGMPYTTLEEDEVIAAVRALFPNTLPANSTTGGQEVEPLGHGFETAYLAVPTAREQILGDVFDVEALLPQPEVANADRPAEPPANCTDASPVVTIGTPVCTPETFRGTCVEDFFGACWDPSGACTLDLKLLGDSNLRWANGAGVRIVPDLSNFEHPRASAAVVGSSGQECAHGESFSSADPTCIAGAQYTSAQGTLRYCIDGYGVLRGVCPDGTTFARKAQPNCIFGQGAGECAF